MLKPLRPAQAQGPDSHIKALSFLRSWYHSAGTYAMCSDPWDYSGGWAGGPEGACGRDGAQQPQAPSPACGQSLPGGEGCLDLL